VTGGLDALACGPTCDPDAQLLAHPALSTGPFLMVRILKKLLVFLCIRVGPLGFTLVQENCGRFQNIPKILGYF
jgi:hypothetical protein